MKPDPFANMTMVDLTFPVYDDMPIWSAEPRCIIRNWIVMDRKHGSREPLNMKYYCMSGHQGTHTDAPFHFNYEGRKIDEIPLRRYMGWTKVLDFTEKKLGDFFTAADFEKRGVADGDRVLIHTGWDRYFKPFDPLYYDLGHPHFSADGVEWILGTNSPSWAWTCLQPIRTSSIIPRFFETRSNSHHSGIDDKPGQDCGQGSLFDGAAHAFEGGRRVVGEGRCLRAQVVSRN